MYEADEAGLNDARAEVKMADVPELSWRTHGLIAALMVAKTLLTASFLLLSLRIRLSFQ